MAVLNFGALSVKKYRNVKSYGMTTHPKVIFLIAISRTCTGEKDRENATSAVTFSIPTRLRNQQ